MYFIFGLLLTLFFAGGVIAWSDILEMRQAKSDLAVQETVTVSALSTDAHDIAKRLIAPKLPGLLDARSPYFATDVAFLEDLLGSAISSLMRYGAVARSARLDRVIQLLRDGSPGEAIAHMKRIEDVQIRRGDKHAIARSHLYLGAFYLLADLSSARARLLLAAEYDASGFTCQPCLRRFLLGANAVVAAAPTPRARGNAPKALESKPPSAAAPQVQLEQRFKLRPAREAPAPQELKETAPSPPAAVQTRPAIAAATPKEDLAPIVRYEPDYPVRALRLEKEGYAIVSFSITPSGMTDNVKTIESHPAGLFEAAAEGAVWRWRYAPQPASVTGMRARFDFRLR